MPRNSTFFIVALAGSLLCCDRTFAAEGEPSAKVVELFGGRENFDVMHNASEIQIFHLRRKAGNPPTAAREAYDVVGKEWTFNESSRRELVALLSAEKSYDWERAVGCIPDFGYELVFRREKDTLRLAVCMECRMIFVFREGNRVGCEEFDPIADDLQRFIKMLP